MTKILRSVGRGGVNLYSDVITVQKLLNQQRLPGVTGQLKYDGDAGNETTTRIEIFQKNIVKMPKPDGRIDPGGRTMVKLTGTTQSKSSGLGKLTEADFQAAAKALGSNVEVAMVKAIAKAESGGRSGFNAAGLPVIAYEGHIFRERTTPKYKYDKTHPLLSYEYGKKAGAEWKKNNQNQVTAWATLEAATKLDRAAAYQACSWGMFQVMGFNYRMCGFSSVDTFVEAMKAGEMAQLKAFVAFCTNTPGLKEALANKNFTECARLYNGKDYGDYDKIIREAYKKYSDG